MIKPFKFFKGYVYSDEYTFQDTPEGHMSRRYLYHTNQVEYDRLRHPNNEMERYFYDRGFRETPRGQFGSPERHRDILRRINEQRDLNDNPIRLFNTTKTVTVNPTFWNRVKIFGTRIKLVLIESWRAEPVGIVFVGILTTLLTIIAVAKLLGL